MHTGRSGGFAEQILACGGGEAAAAGVREPKAHGQAAAPLPVLF